MKDINRFCFVEDILTPKHQGRVVIIDNGIKSSNELFESFNTQLDLPGYFGFNWNALNDCLLDLSWLDCGNIEIVHKSIPLLGTEETSIYIDILFQCASAWRNDESKSVSVVFPSSLRSVVAEYLGL